MVLNVRKYGDPVLRRRARPVETVTPEIKRVIADMVDTMYDEVGLGLAAPQVGISLRLMVVGDDDGREARALINPVIAEQGGEIVAEEGCLSIPGYVANVKRAWAVTVKAKNRHGRDVRVKGEGLFGQALQHEIDHLDGILYVDRLDDMSQLRKVEPGRRGRRRDAETEPAPVS